MTRPQSRAFLYAMKHFALGLATTLFLLVLLTWGQWHFFLHIYRHEIAIGRRGHIDLLRAMPSELDMLNHSVDIPLEGRAQITTLFRQSAKVARQNEEEARKWKGRWFRRLLEPKPDPAAIAEARGKFEALQVARVNQMGDAMEKIAAITRPTRVDPDYVYRAFLREHRRLLPGFNH